MTNNEFRLWLQGFRELSEHPTLNPKQVQIVKNHADLVKATVGTLDADIQLFIHKCKQKVQEGAKEISLDKDLI